MQRVTKLKVAMTAENTYQVLIATYGLIGGEKIAHEVWKLFRAERLRRKGIKK